MERVVGEGEGVQGLGNLGGGVVDKVGKIYQCPNSHPRRDGRHGAGTDVARQATAGGEEREEESGLRGVGLSLWISSALEGNARAMLGLTIMNYWVDYTDDGVI